MNVALEGGEGVALVEDGREEQGLIQGLGIDQLRIVTVLWAATMLGHISQRQFVRAILGMANIQAIVMGALAVCSLLVLFRSSSVKLFVALCALFVIRYLAWLPTASNHSLVAFLFTSAVVLAYFWVWKTEGDPDEHRRKFFDAFAPVGRVLLFITYFFGVFHKVNTDWFDPAVSCGVVSMNSLLGPFGLNNAVTDAVAIYGTLVVEVVAAVLLWLSRWKWLGFFLGLTFHLFVLTFTFAWFAGFTVLAVALYSLFLPVEYGALLERFLTRTARHHRTAKIVALSSVAILGLVLYWASVASATTDSWVLRRVGSKAYLLFVNGILLILGGAFLTSVLALCRTHEFKNPSNMWRPRPLALMLLPLLFVVNNVGPYLGYKTDGVISMFSNLHTEGGVTNHLLFDKPPYIVGMQSNLVRVVSAPPQVRDWLVDAGQFTADDEPPYQELQIPELALRIYLHRHPEVGLTYEDAEGLHVVEPVADGDRRQAPSWFAQKFLLFKPVDFRRPKVCTH